MPNRGEPATVDEEGFAAVVVENLSKRFGEVQALTEVSLEVRNGSVMAILGLIGS